MKIINLCEEILNKNFDNIKNDLLNYFDNTFLNDIYFLPKKVNKKLINEKLNNENYLNKVRNTIMSYQNSDIVQIVFNRLKDFEDDTKYEVNDEIIYLIIGLDTTTIYSTNYNGLDVTVLLLESTNGDKDNLDMLLAHEYTHFIRRKLLDKDIFNESIGERFITEGIASNYSREVVPTKRDEDYCIVPSSTVIWVKNNINLIDELVKSNLDNNNLMEQFFYMYTDINVDNMPVRTGYVYGYLKVKEYIDKYNLKIKDILGIDWRKIIEG